MNKRLMMSTSDTSLAPLMYVRALLPTSSVKVPKGSVVSKIKDRWFQAQALVSFKKCMPPPPFPTSAQYFSLICDPFADPIISLHSRDISLFDCHI